MLLLTAWWGAREVLGLMGEQGSEQECLSPLRVWKAVNKTCFFQHELLGHVLRRHVVEPRSAQLQFDKGKMRKPGHE